MVASTVSKVVNGIVVVTCAVAVVNVVAGTVTGTTVVG